MLESKQDKYKSPVTAILTGIFDLFRRSRPDCFLMPSDRLDGKTVLVDGASSGLGFAIATEVARRGAKVIMACRSGIPEKGEKVKKLSGNNDVHMVFVDFRDLSGIRHLASVIQDKYAPIDIYICNSAIVPYKSRKTPQGLEEMFMVNYLSKFIFVNLLFSPLSAPIPNPSPTRGKGVERIIFITSESHRNPKEFIWNDFGKYREYGINKSVELYGYYKLYLVTFARELSRRLNKPGTPGISVFALCPGPVNSNIAREAPKIFKPLLKLVFGIFFRSPQKAATPAVYLAASKEEEGKPFDYLFLMNRKTIDPKAEDPENGKKLWDLSENLITELLNR